MRNVRQTRSPKAWARQLREAFGALGCSGRRHTPLLKDPMALFAAPWLSERFDTRAVVMIRHPAAFVGSIKKLNWGFDYEVNWLEQELLMRDLLAGFEEDFRGYVGEVDLVHEGIVMWNAFHHVINRFRIDHPEWIFVKYEDLTDDPESGFRALYDRLDLPWNEDIAAEIRRHASGDNPKDVPTWRRRAVKRDSRAAKSTWRYRLTPDEISRIRDGTAEVAGHFYSDDDWDAGTEIGPPNSSRRTPP